MLKRILIFSVFFVIYGQLYCMQSDDDRCTLCQSVLGADSVPTPCGHRFHYKCLVEWLTFRRLENKSTICPNCRRSPTPDPLQVLPVPVLEDEPLLPSSPTIQRRVLSGWIGVVLGTRRASDSTSSEPGHSPQSQR